MMVYLFMTGIPTNFQANLRWPTIKNIGPRIVRLEMKYPVTWMKEEMIKAET